MKRSIFFLFIILIFMSACKRNNKHNIAKKVVETARKHIEDKRTEYWDVEIQNIDGKTVFSGSTISQKAYMELQSLAKRHKIGFGVHMLPTNDFQKNNWGVVTISVCNIRGNGRHSAELVTQALMGTPVKIFAKNEGWYLVQTPDRYFGWVDEAAIALKNKAELNEWKVIKKVLYKNQFGFAYEKSNENGAVECDLGLANLLSVVDEEQNFYKILLADGRTAFVKKEECVSLDKWKAKKYSVDDLLSAAYNFKGVPYLWGGTSAKMVDCSGFTKTVYYMNGVILQRDASQQTLYGSLVDTKNDYNNLQAGDLVFFGKKAEAERKELVTHVGLYIGGSEFIHASGKVRINSLNRNDENYTGYYETAFVRARRIIGNNDGRGIEWVTDNEFYKEILP